MSDEIVSREYEAGLQEMVCHCIFSGLKKTILEAIQDKVSKRIINIIESIPNCDSPQGVANLEQLMAAQQEGKAKKRTAYQQHISECMKRHSSEIKGKPFGAAQGPMKSCVTEWNEEKKKGRKE